MIAWICWMSSIETLLFHDHQDDDAARCCLRPFFDKVEDVLPRRGAEHVKPRSVADGAVANDRAGGEA